MMKNKLVNRLNDLLFFVPLALWSVLIFFFSAQPAVQSKAVSGAATRVLLSVMRFFGLSAQSAVSVEEPLENVIRKGAHFCAFLVLGLLALWFFFALCRRRSGFSGMPLIPPAYIYAFTYCVMYSVSDEIHQLFVAGRACRFLDVLIDSGGSALGLACILLFTRLESKKKNGLG